MSMTSVRRWYPLLLVVLSLFAHPSNIESASAAESEPPKLLGFATQWDLIPEDVSTLSSSVGKPPAIYQSFWTLEMDYPDSGLIGGLDGLDSLGMTPYLELTTDDLGAVLEGRRDEVLDQVIRVSEQWLAGRSGRYLLVAPLAEANLVEHRWGGDPDGYRSVYAYIHDAFRSAGMGRDRVRFVFAMNGLDTSGYPYSRYYPGDEYVDILGFAKLNRGGRDYEEVFAGHIREMQEEIGYVKPILITQTGTIDTASDPMGPWLNEMFDGLLGEEQVLGAIYFNRNKDKDFRVVKNGWVHPSFADGYATWSDSSDVAWVFDGRMDAWIADREAWYSRFVDIASSTFFDDIMWIADQGITQGCAPGRYCPDDPVSRAQMASFLARALSLPAASSDYFDDDAGVHEDNINRLREAGITFGCAARAFCPDEDVTREQMASFLARALGYPEASADWFSDDDGSTHEPNINRVADAGVTFGCGSGVYCPGDPVTRGQMAAFLHRALGF